MPRTDPSAGRGAKLGGMGNETTALDIVTVVVAGYAALVGTFALAFQAISWLRSWSTRVELKLTRSELMTLGSAESEPVILFTIINHSSHEVKITSLGFRPQRKGGMGFVILQPLPLGTQLPVKIAARDATTLWTTPDKFPAGVDLDRKIQAEVGTSDGKGFTSKRVPARSLAEPKSE